MASDDTSFSYAKATLQRGYTGVRGSLEQLAVVIILDEADLNTYRFAHLVTTYEYPNVGCEDIIIRSPSMSLNPWMYSYQRERGPLVRTRAGAY
eukprot:scaffold378978_cov37-Prasinocladus_malaysianus.AAC.1